MMLTVLGIVARADLSLLCKKGLTFIVPESKSL